MTYLIDGLLDHLIEKSDYQEEDRTYLFNRLQAILGRQAALVEGQADFYEAKELLLDQAQVSGWIGEDLASRDQANSQIMDLLTPSPSLVNQRFWDNYAESPETALAYFYQLSLENENIKSRDIGRNISFQSPSPYGELDITINLSKPEKDPKAIAAQKEERSDYPACPICVENEGYLGDAFHPARSQHRLIRFPLEGEDWAFHYSPYAYYQEHAIFLSQDHHPMAVTPKTFKRLLSLVDLFPSYFVGSNAGLPIIGGSILGHDHYQGGRYEFPMDRALLLASYQHARFPQVGFQIHKWPMAFIRLHSKDRGQLEAAATHILETWNTYDDPSLNIRSSSQTGPHHSLTPIARKRGDTYQLDLVLRDNQTNDQYPDGIFHPHPDVQHIKKENIGLIEVMGLAILPPRLKGELEEVAAFLCGQIKEIKSVHESWAHQLLDQYGLQTEEQVTDLLEKEVGRIFCRVLEDAGVFKNDQSGQAGLLRFLKHLGLS